MSDSSRIIYDIVKASIEGSIDIEGLIHIEVACERAASAIAAVTLVRPSAEEMAQWRLDQSLAAEDPYSVLAPEQRAMYPLTNEMVAQNQALLIAAVEQISVDRAWGGRSSHSRKKAG